MVDLAPCPACGAACSQQDFEGPNFKGKIWLCSKNHMMRGGECRGDMYLSEEAWQEHALPPSDEDWVEVVYRAIRDGKASFGHEVSLGQIMTTDELKTIAQAALTALTPLIAKVREEALEGWQPMETAPRDRTWIWAMLGEGASDSRHVGHMVGRCFEIRHEGRTLSRYDLGWSLYPGYGGAPDSWFVGWMPKLSIQSGHHIRAQALSPDGERME